MRRVSRLGGGWGILLFTAFAVAALLTACGQQKTAANQPPVAIKASDRSVVCGMYITKYPGPRGEVYLSGVREVIKEGSIRDLFGYIRRPDVAPRVESIYVQDTAHIDWAHPSNSPKSFIDARKAYYVAWQPRRGMMGPTFAPFAKRADAEAFIRVHGGAVLHFAQITSALVSRLAYTCPSSGSPFYRLASRANCVTKTAAAAPAGEKSGLSGKMMIPSMH